MNAEVLLDRPVDELLVVLDEEIAQIDVTMERLDGLRSAVIRRDEEGLQALLETVRVEGERYRAVEARREDLRVRLARIAGCGVNEMNLSVLCGMLEGARRAAVAAKQEQLRDLTERLRREHLSTTLLLRECSRLNKMMLKGMFARGDEPVIYNARGNASMDIQNETVSMRF